MVSLTGDGATGRQVALLRCGACNANRWRLDGVEVDKATALGALNATYAPAAPARRSPRRRTESAPAAVSPQVVEVAAVEVTVTAAAAPGERPADLQAALSELLAGWTVLGSS